MPMVALCDWRSSKGIRRCTRTSPTSARDTDTTRTKSASRNVVAMSPTMSHILAISRSYAGDSGPGLWTSAKHYLEVSGAVLRRMVGDAAGGMRVSENIPSRQFVNRGAGVLSGAPNLFVGGAGEVSQPIL